jgi:hypothetical protein
VGAAILAPAAASLFVAGALPVYVVLMISFIILPLSRLFDGIHLRSKLVDRSISASLSISYSGAVVLASKAVKEAKNVHAERQRRSRQRAQARQTRAQRMTANVESNCSGFHNASPDVLLCLSCSGLACEHVFPSEGQYPGANPFVCELCNHYEAHDNACAHFFAEGRPSCLFCHARRPSQTSEAQRTVSLVVHAGANSSTNGPLDVASDSTSSATSDSQSSTSSHGSLESAARLFEQELDAELQQALFMIAQMSEAVSVA